MPELSLTMARRISRLCLRHRRGIKSERNGQRAGPPPTRVPGTTTSWRAVPQSPSIRWLTATARSSAARRPRPAGHCSVSTRRRPSCRPVGLLGDRDPRPGDEHDQAPRHHPALGLRRGPHGHRRGWQEDPCEGLQPPAPATEPVPVGQRLAGLYSQPTPSPSESRPYSSGPITLTVPVYSGPLPEPPAQSTSLAIGTQGSYDG